MEKADKEAVRPAVPAEEKLLSEKDADFKLACRRYARMRARTSR